MSEISSKCTISRYDKVKYTTVIRHKRDKFVFKRHLCQYLHLHPTANWKSSSLDVFSHCQMQCVPFCHAVSCSCNCCVSDCTSCSSCLIRWSFVLMIFFHCSGDLLLETSSLCCCLLTSISSLCCCLLASISKQGMDRLLPRASIRISWTA